MTFCIYIYIYSHLKLKLVCKVLFQDTHTCFTHFSLPEGLARSGKEAGSGQVYSAARGSLPSLHTTTAAQVGREATMDSRQSAVCPQWDREGRCSQLY